jgi:hypothetical protein
MLEANIKETDQNLQEHVLKFITKHWGAPKIVSQGRIHYIDQLPGFVATIGEENQT